MQSEPPQAKVPVPVPPPHMQQQGAPELFARAVSRQAVAQITLAVGCKHSYTSVLDALTDLVQDFVQTVAMAAQAKAESGGRTQVSMLDVVAALEETPQQHGGRDRYELDWRALRGFAFRDVALAQADRPEAFQWYQPFHTHIPPFPVPAAAGRKRARPPAGAAEEDGEGQRRRPAYVPSFLPPFPAEHTFRKTGIRATAKTEDPAAIQQHRIATKQLILKAMQRATGAAAAASSAGPAEGEEEGTDPADADSVVSLPEAAASLFATAAPPSRGNGGRRGAAVKKGAAAAGRRIEEAGMEEDEDLFSADAQPFKPVASAGSAKEEDQSAVKPGAAVSGARS
jgi:histone H3/H4